MPCWCPFPVWNLFVLCNWSYLVIGFLSFRTGNGSLTSRWWYSAFVSTWCGHVHGVGVHFESHKLKRLYHTENRQRKDSKSFPEWWHWHALSFSLEMLLHIVLQKQDQRSSKMLTFRNATRNIWVISWRRNGFIRFRCINYKNKVSEWRVHKTKIILTYKWLQNLILNLRQEWGAKVKWGQMSKQVGFETLLN